MTVFATKFLQALKKQQYVVHALNFKALPYMTKTYLSQKCIGVSQYAKSEVIKAMHLQVAV